MRGLIQAPDQLQAHLTRRTLSELRPVLRQRVSGWVDSPRVRALREDARQRLLRLLQRTGTALSEIESRVLKINDHIHSIASSAKEQSTGLQEVNAAINQMDQVTQQNAAMVEEQTAASHALAT